MSNRNIIYNSIDGTDYSFVTIDRDVTSSNTGSVVPFDSVKIYEGTYVTSTYTVDSRCRPKFLLNDSRADTSTLTVKVQNSSSDTTTTTYTKATDITQLSSTTTVYYLQETDSGLFEVYFGDGVVSKGLSDGNIN